MENVPPTGLPIELKQWIVTEAQYVIPVMDYLRRHQSEFFTMITLSDLDAISGMEDEAKHFHLAHPNGRVAKAWEREQEYARQLMSTGQLVLCSECCAKVVSFSEGQKVSWPELGTHECMEV